MAIRLLHATELIFNEFVGDAIPPYAIISHRWTQEEVSYQDFLTHRPAYLRGERRSYGWTKMLEAARLTKFRGHNYFWLDTCCIDKKSSAELSEAINSMFNWYKRSVECYVFLRDVERLAILRDHRGPTDAASREWQYVQFDGDEFRQSSWFTRAWTLQELLAPPKVYFFNNVFECFGTRNGHANLISATTGIPEEYLSSRSKDAQYSQPKIYGASIAERMRWASSREATRKEDLSYSLLGLFDINMPLLYGEEERAFYRLQVEIIRKSVDETIFAWSDHHVPGWRGLLAPHVKAFSGEGEFYDFPEVSRQHYEVTSKGVRVLLPLPMQRLSSVLTERTQFTALIMLNCRKRGHSNDGSATKLSVFLLALIWPPLTHSSDEPPSFLFGSRMRMETSTYRRAVDGSSELPSAVADVEPEIVVAHASADDIQVPVYFRTGW